MNVIVIETPELGDRSYLVHDGTHAVVVDPQRDIDRVMKLAQEHRLKIGFVLETHLHNDYVTGGLELSKRTAATYLVGGGEEADYDCTPVSDGDDFQLGSMTIKVIGSPGHTVNHVSYLVTAPEWPGAVFTGGSMLYGTVGRTDLVSAELTNRLTHEQYHSTRRIANELPDDVEVQPTHGFGSFCSSASTSGASESTVAIERSTNVACTTDDEDTFVKNLLAGLTAYPSYYSHMGILNRTGTSSAFELTAPRRLGIDELKDRLDAKLWVIDLRSRKAYAAKHLSSSIGVEHSTSFTTYLGWILPWGMPLTLLGETEAQIESAQRDLFRIGIERVDGAALIGEELLSQLPTRSYKVSDFKGLAQRIKEGPSPHILDVRRDDEWESGHVGNAQHISLQELSKRLDDVPSGEVWVHCAAGFRASIGASIIDSSERQITLINDDFSNAGSAGLEVA